MPCLTELYQIFYITGLSPWPAPVPVRAGARAGNKKIIPDNIYDLLTPRALAHWIQGDGK